MDSELKAYLDQMKADIHMDLRAQILDLKNEIRAEMAELRVELKQHTEMVETRLLSAFWKWARTMESKTRQLSVDVMAINERLNIIEERVTDLEQGR